MSALASVNKAAIVLVFVLLGGLAGFGWYKFMYTPANAEKLAAQTRMDTAVQGLQAKQAELAQVNNKGTDRKSFGSILATKVAIPRNQNVEEAYMQVDEMARKSGVVIVDLSPAADAGPAGSASQQVDITVNGHATYRGLVIFLQRLQESVDAHRGKVYVAGRLINIQSLTINTVDPSGVPEEDALPKGHLMFTVILRAYAESVTPSSTAAEPEAAAAPAAGQPGATGATATPAAPATGTAGATTQPPAATPGASSTTTVPPGAS